MALASTSRVQLRYARELVFGVTPNAPSVTRELRFTGESLNFNLSKEVSQEINADRASSSQVAVGAEASGSINAELSYAEYDEFFSGTLQNTWELYGTDGIGTSFSLTSTATTLTASAAPVGSSAFTTLKLGQWFTLRGFAIGTPNYRRLFRVSKTVAPTSTVITLDPGTPAAIVTAQAGIAVSTSRLSNGVVQPSYSIERESGDTAEFFNYRGMTPSSMTLNMAAGSITTLEFDFMGKDVTARDTTSYLPGTPAASRAYDIMSGVSGTSCELWVKGSPLTGTYINSIDFSYDNSLRQQTALCVLGSVGIGSGTIVASITAELYFSSGRTFFQEMLDNENFELAFTAFDALGNGYVFTLPKANVATYTVNAGSRDADLLVSVEVTGLLDKGNAVPALRKVVMLDRMGDAVNLVQITNQPATGNPSITGTPAVGQILTANTTAIADADGLGTFSYVWRRNGVAIPGATTVAYTAVGADQGNTLTVVVNFTDADGFPESRVSPGVAIA